MNKNDIKEIYYKDPDSKVDITDYSQILEKISIGKSKTIYVETLKIPIHFNGEKSVEFEDEIKNFVERELRIAANNIK